MSEDRMTPRDEIEVLLPFYLNGTLDGADLAKVEEWLATDPNAMAALGAAEAEFAASSAANEAIRPPADALERFSAALAAEPRRARRQSPATWVARQWSRLTALPPGLAWATATAAVLALAIVAAVEGTGGRSDVRVAGTEQAAAEQPFILVTFRPDASIAEVTALLEEAGAAIDDGPKPGGVYRVAIPTGDAEEYDRISAAIAAAPLVEAVIAGRKPGNAQ